MTIRHFDHTHETVAEVRACDPNASGRTATATLNRPIPQSDKTNFGSDAPAPAPAPQPARSGSRRDRRVATDPMVRYVRSIATLRSMAEDDAAEAMRYVAAHEAGEKPMSFDWARDFINTFKDAPLKTVRDRIHDSNAKRAVITEDGMYRNPATGQIWKVQHTRETTRLYAKLLVIVSEPERDDAGKVVTPAVVRFEYAPGAMVKIQSQWRMTLEEAQAFGALYGTCCVCGRTLTREQSINAGIGPKCGADGRWAAGRETTTVLAEV